MRNGGYAGDRLLRNSSHKTKVLAERAFRIPFGGIHQTLDDDLGVGRDQNMTVKALEAFDSVVRRYPTSPYARDAQLKMDLARDHLAGKEMEIGRTYQSLDFYLAAINRFRTVIERYQTTSHVPEALHRLTESYLALGVTKEAEVAAAVLGYNFPGSTWYTASYALLRERDLEPRLSKQSWLTRLF